MSTAKLARYAVNALLVACSINTVVVGLRVVPTIWEADKLDAVLIATALISMVIFWWDSRP